MAQKVILIEDSKDLTINFWDGRGYYDYYRTIIATEKSYVTKAKLKFNISAPHSLWRCVNGAVAVLINDREVLHEGILGGVYTFEIDITGQIKPPAGYPGQAINKITFSLWNPNWPFWGHVYKLESAYLILDYSAEVPAYPTAPEPEGYTGTGTAIDAMFGQIMQFMFMFMMMSMLMSVTAMLIRAMPGD